MNRVISAYKNAYSGLSPSAWWLSAVMLVNRSGTMVLPFLSLYMTESLDVSYAKAGFVVALFGVGAICGGFLGGKLTDKFSFYFIMMTALIGGGLLFILLGQIRSYFGICITTFLLSVVNESFRPANAAAIAHYSKVENRTRSFSLNRLAINLGWAVGGALGGFIASKNYELLFWIDGLTNISAAMLLWIFLAPSKNSATAAGRPEQDGTEKVKPPHRDGPYMIFIVLTTLYAACFFQLFTTMPLFFKRGLMISEVEIGIVMATNGLMIALMEMVIIHRLEGRRNYLSYITNGTILVAVSFLIYIFLPGAFMLALLSTVFLTIGEILSMPFMNSFWIARTTNSNRGQYAGWYTVSWSVAQVIGPVSGTQIAQHFGFMAMLWFIGILSLLTAAGYKWLDARISGQSGQTPSPSLLKQTLRWLRVPGA